MPHHPETRPASSRQRLLDAAKRLFAASGYEQTATSAIAREAGTSESQLMRYFGGKVGLLEALFDDAWSHLSARVDRAIKNSKNSGECILDALQALVTAFSRDPDLATLFMFEGRRMRGDEPRVRLSRGFVHFADTIRRLIREAQDAREVDPALDATALTSALLGATEAMIRDRLLAKRKSARGFAEREIRRTLEAMWRGTAPAQVRPASPRTRHR